MTKAFKDIMMLGEGGTYLVIAWLITGLITSIIVIIYFGIATRKQLKEDKYFNSLIKRLDNGEEKEQNNRN